MNCFSTIIKSTVIIRITSFNTYDLVLRIAISHRSINFKVTLIISIIPCYFYSVLIKYIVYNAIYFKSTHADATKQEHEQK